MKDDFISIHDLGTEEFQDIMARTEDMKKNPGRYAKVLENKILAMIFQKPSLRTRMTFEAGMLRLGGEAIYLGPSDIQLGDREGAYDIGRNLERWVDGIMIRTFAHSLILDLAEATRIPVINALTDLLHPCQAMADFFTLLEKKGRLKGVSLAFIGDGNNVCHSLMFAAAKSGARVIAATPEGYEPNADIVRTAREDAKATGAEIELTHDPKAAVRDADAVYTDVWASMGQESEKEKRAAIFAPYQVNASLMSAAKPDTLFMHCLPAHRGEEVTDEVIDSPNSVVFDQAENRLHVQKVIMTLLMGSRS